MRVECLKVSACFCVADPILGACCRPFPGSGTIRLAAPRTQTHAVPLTVERVWVIPGPHLAPTRVGRFWAGEAAHLLHIESSVGKG